MRAWVKSPLRVRLSQILRPDQSDCGVVVCCIYHKPREVGESSSESSSDSSSDDDSDDTNDDGAARPTIRKAKQGSDKHGHGHEHDDHNCHDIGGRGAKLTKGKGKKVSTNAYERQPKND